MKFGFIGAGNMASAIMTGIIRGGICQPSDIYMSDIDVDKLVTLGAQYGVSYTGDNCTVAKASDAVIIAVKPNTCAEVLSEIADDMRGKIVISIAAGWTTAMLKNAVGECVRVLRVMPNTPALVGEGMIALSLENDLSSDERAWMESLFGALGRVRWVNEGDMEAVIGVSGSGPAYFFLFIEAMADVGIAHGLKPELSYELVIQTAKGAAMLAQNSDHDVIKLREMVCSPGGTTIEAVKAFERLDLRGIVKEAIDACINRARELNR